ncbi:hypothetical protein OAC05_05640, partial [Planktomarina temperata]|nr:hypothetical protein [Planktomarina temperata]
GMRDFTINAPHTRDFHSSILINDTMRYKKILAPKDGYFNVILNGKNIGKMYFEERYSEQFTERARKPFGPILSFDEKANMHRFADDKKFWSNDQFLRIAASNIESLLSDPEKNLNLINQNIWAEYLAITFLFKCFHGNVAINLSHYFHPISKKFEPISSDNACGQKEIGRKFGYLPYQDEFIFKLLQIEPFRKLLEEKLLWWYESKDATAFIRELNIKEKKLRRTLFSDAPFIQKFSISNTHIPAILEWMKDMQKLDMKNVLTPSKIIKSEEMPQLTVLKKNDELVFSVSAFSKERYILDELIIEFADKTENIKLSNNINERDITSKINNPGLVDAFTIKGMHYTFFDTVRQRKHNLNVNLFFSQVEFQPFGDTKIDDLSDIFILDKLTHNFSTKKNDILEITETLIIPENYTLSVNSGTTLTFSDNAGLIVKGSFEVNGTDEDPVIF